jgi:hypothetical protein
LRNVRISLLGILVEVLHVRVRRSGVQIEVVFLHIFAVIALAIIQSEKPLLDNRVGSVPEGQCETKNLPVVGDAGKAVFAPAVGSGSGLVMAEVVPGISVVAVVFTDSAPLAFAQVGPPFFSGGCIGSSLFKTSSFVVHLSTFRLCATA